MKRTENQTGFLVYPENIGEGTTVKIGVLITPHYLTQDLVLRLKEVVTDTTTIFCDAANSRAHLSREVDATTVKEEAEKFQRELRGVGIITQLSPLPTSKDVEIVLTAGEE